MRPAWAAWSAYVVREKSEEDEFFDREEGLLRFASSLSRLGMRRDRARKQRALSVWRLGAARSAMVTARLEAAAGAEVARAAEGEKVRMVREGSRSVKIGVALEMMAHDDDAGRGGRREWRWGLKFT